MGVNLHGISEDLVIFKSSYQTVREVFMLRFLKQLWRLTLELMKVTLEIFTFPQNTCSRSSQGLSNKLGLIHSETYSNLLDKKQW